MSKIFTMKCPKCYKIFLCGGRCYDKSGNCMDTKDNLCYCPDCCIKLKCWNIILTNCPRAFDKKSIILGLIFT